MTERQHDEPAVPVTGLTFERLVELIREGEQVAADLKGKQRMLDTELQRRTQQTGISRLEMLGKDHGVARFDHEGIALKVAANKVVKWDNDKLKAIAAALPWNAVEKLFDIKFSVPELTYKAVVDEDLLTKLNGARTTRIDPVKVSIA